MAKLNARGRTEVFRVVRALPDSDLATGRIERYALMSDRVVLRHFSVVFKGDTKRHNYGWKRHGRCKADRVNDLLQDLLAHGWLLEGSPALDTSQAA